MTGRKFTSVGLAFTAILASITGVILFMFKSFVPASMIGYVKHIHEWISIAFLIFIVFHTFYNIKPLIKYLSGKKFIISKEAVINFAVVIIVTTGVIISVYADKKDRALSIYPEVENIELKLLLQSSNVDYENALTNLQKNGYIIPDNDLTLEALSEANKTNPKVLYSIMAQK